MSDMDYEAALRKTFDPLDDWLKRSEAAAFIPNRGSELEGGHHAAEQLVIGAFEPFDEVTAGCERTRSPNDRRQS